MSIWLLEGELNQSSSESDCYAVQLSTSSPITRYVCVCVCAVLFSETLLRVNYSISVYFALACSCVTKESCLVIIPSPLTNA